MLGLVLGGLLVLGGCANSWQNKLVKKISPKITNFLYSQEKGEFFTTCEIAKEIGEKPDEVQIVLDFLSDPKLKERWSFFKQEKKQSTGYSNFYTYNVYKLRETIYEQMEKEDEEKERKIAEAKAYEEFRKKLFEENPMQAMILEELEKLNKSNSRLQATADRNTLYNAATLVTLLK